MAKGESLDALLAPSLRVSRPVAACSRCRSAKIKCDGKLPACTACERSGKADSCSGANDEYAKGKERSYVAALEAALERLQRRLAESKALQATDPSRRDSIAASYILGPGHPLSPRRIASGGRVHRKEASDVDNLVGDFGFLSVNATSRDFHGFTATMSFARLLLAVSRTGELLPADTRSLPARYSITPLIQDYLDNIFVLMPFFSETDFIASVSALYAEAGRHAKATDQWMVRMVLAIVAARRSQEKNDADYRVAQEHVCSALSYAEDVLHPGSITGIQAILLLVQYSILDPDLFSSWHLIGFASRVMVDLGLHNEPAAEVRLSKGESEMRRRVFYCVYTLDRNISMALERAFSFTDDSASVSLPAVPPSTIASDPGRNTGVQLFLRSLQPSLYLFDIRRVQSSLYQQACLSDRSEWPDATVSTYTDSVLTDIRSWFSSIPAAVPESQLVLFRLESLYSQIVALSPSCRITNITELSRTLVFEYAIQYADQLHPITKENKWHAFFTLIEIHRINFIARQFLNIMWASFDHLISATVPHISSSSPEAEGKSPSTAPSPPSPNISRPTSALENSVRATRFLTKTLEVLTYAQKRFGNSCASIRIKFEQESAVLMNKLRMKQQELSTVQYITGGPPPPQRLPVQPVVGQKFSMPSDPGLQMLRPIQPAPSFIYQQHQQPPPSPPPQQQRPPQLIQHVSYPGTVSEQQKLQTQYQQDLMSLTHQALQTQPQPQPQQQPSAPRFVRHLSHGSHSTEPFGQLSFAPLNNTSGSGGSGGEGGAAGNAEFALMPEGSLPRRSYEFLGTRGNGAQGGNAD
jgi:Fungal specific transcription factor domain/Fungal Zn(2)-Cys(6) binuclear cluster domain